MQLQSLWSGFTQQQYDYITNIIKNSDAKTVCELGTFVGTAAQHIWNAIKDTDKKLYLVDNYKFIPEDKREKFFNTVKDSIDKDTDNIVTILQSSHDYDWTKHNFIFFGHHNAAHMLPDLQTLIFSDVDYAIIGDGIPGCFQRTKATFEYISQMTGKGLYPQYYLNGLIVLGRKELECTLPTEQDYFFGQKIKYMPKAPGSYLKAVDELKRIYQLDN
tara:strand:- start:8429 stop:9079 length:651 start_codon:yes stop_codon:yes gene_type:complete